MIHIIFGPSGSGKTNFCRQLRKLNDKFGNISLHRKMTTRQKKVYDGDEIVPCSTKELYDVCGGNSGYIYESRDYCGNKYEFGISKKAIEHAIKKGEEHFIICNNFNIAQKIRKDFMLTVPVRIVYLMYNAKKEEIIKQIREKLTEECDIFGKKIPKSKHDECANNRYKKILSIRKKFNDNVYEFDGVIFNRFAHGESGTDAMWNLQLQIEREIHLQKELELLKVKIDYCSIQRTHPKLFISHSRKDKKYVDAFINLIESTGLPRDSIFYSSDPRYGIQNGSHIYNEIINHLQYDVKLVIFISSKNFYESRGCLMELGATWALNLKNTNIGLPNWDMSQGIGPTDSTHVSILLTHYDDANARLDQLRNTIVEIFGLDSGEDEKWPQIKKEFFYAIKDSSKKDGSSSGKIN